VSLYEINRVVVTGRLTRDPELKQTSTGKSVCSIRIAVNKSVKDPQTGEWGDRPSFVNVTVWERIGENVARQCGKGDRILIEGELRWREWEHEGSKRQEIDIVAQKAIPMGRTDAAQSQQRPLAPAQAPAAGPWPGPDGFAPSGVDDDIPF
jgi:single-strand DNA-binding protein